MPRLASIISEAWQARHAAANKPARFNEWLDDGAPPVGRDRSASDGPALREASIRARSRSASATTGVGKTRSAGRMGAGGALVRKRKGHRTCRRRPLRFRELLGRVREAITRFDGCQRIEARTASSQQSKPTYPQKPSNSSLASND